VPVRALVGKAIALATLLVVGAGCQRSDVSGTQKTVGVEIGEGQSAERKAEALERNVANGSKAAPAVSDLIGRPEAQSVDPTGREPLDDALTCLARSIYWEARGAGTDAMESVANIVMNRLAHEGFPTTVCEVVKQGQEQGSCQFSWWCDGRSDSAFEDEPYAAAKEIARKALNRQLPDRTGGALYFHHHGVSPSWAQTFVKTGEVADFSFYKPDA
jgi:spore germination cell wall hydrolase CwlJ-like protein